jgi:hypothetical protein
MGQRTDKVLRAGLTAYIFISPGIDEKKPGLGARAEVKVVGLPAGVEILTLKKDSVPFDISRAK